MGASSIERRGAAFTDEKLRALPNLESIKALGLYDTSVTDDGFHELLRAQGLVQISIASDLLSGKVVEVLAKLPALRSLLVYSGPGIGDKCARHLRKCVELRELYLNQTAITDDGLKQIGELPHVWSLCLNDTIVSDVGCANLASMPQLSLLSLNRTRVVGHGLTGLHDNEHFGLYLESTPASDAGVIGIAERLSKLKLISLCHTGVGDVGARALAKLSGLNDVRFSNTILTERGLAAFSGHPFLDVIYIEGCTIGKSAIKALKKARRGLTVYGP